MFRKGHYVKLTAIDYIVNFLQRSCIPALSMQQKMCTQKKTSRCLRLGVLPLAGSDKELVEVVLYDSLIFSKAVQSPAGDRSRQTYLLSFDISLLACLISTLYIHHLCQMHSMHASCRQLMNKSATGNDKELVGVVQSTSMAMDTFILMVPPEGSPKAVCDPNTDPVQLAIGFQNLNNQRHMTVLIPGIGVLCILSGSIELHLTDLGE